MNVNANLHLGYPLQLNIKSYIFWNSLENLQRNNVYKVSYNVSGKGKTTVLIMFV